MDDGDFTVWLGGLSKLSAVQRRQILATLSAAVEGEESVSSGGAENLAARVSSPDAAPLAMTTQVDRPQPGAVLDGLGKASRDQVERQGCPHCAGRDIAAWGRSHGLPRYRCKSCRRTFNALTKTPMARLRKKERWLDYAKAMIEGTSVAKAAKRCDIHPTTAFRWRHRFLRSPARDKPKTLTGIVEADETFILESFKGRRLRLSRPSRKRGGKARHPGLFFENIPILVARDRAGATFDAVLPQVTRASIAAALEGVVTPANWFICDGGLSITAFARKAKIPFQVVPAPGKPLPGAPEIHINNINAYHGRLKEWLRRFHGVATKNLPNYLGWRRALEAWGDYASPQNWILGAIGMGPYQQLTL